MWSIICVIVVILYVVLFFFFFSSRRRHTRSLCDWSSDVCSSDLSTATIVLLLLDQLIEIFDDLVLNFLRFIARVLGAEAFFRFLEVAVEPLDDLFRLFAAGHRGWSRVLLVRIGLGIRFLLVRLVL